MSESTQTALSQSETGRSHRHLYFYHLSANDAVDDDDDF